MKLILGTSDPDPHLIQDFFGSDMNDQETNEQTT